MPTILLLKGLPASGKSTYAKKIVDEGNGWWKRVNKDDLRALLDNGSHSKSKEAFVLKVRDDIVRKTIEAGLSIVVDDTNLHPKHQAAMEAIAIEYPKVNVVVNEDFLKVPVKECVARDARRVNPVGEKVIRDMARQFNVKQQPKEIYVGEGLPEAIICDLDGTLALLNGRNPYDASTCENDILNGPVHEVLTKAGVFVGGRKVIFISGREERYRLQTQRWLHDTASISHSLYELYIRPTGDNRKDSFVKLDLFNQHVRGKYSVLFVLDDRQQVVDMWREELGLTCLQVAPGDF